MLSALLRCLHPSSRVYRHLRPRKEWNLCTRCYVGTPEEVEEYHASRKRALHWIQSFEPRPFRQEATDAVAIEYALGYHLFDPLSKLSPEKAQLTREDSEQALDVSQALLTDLAPYLCTKNIVTFAERLGRILSYSEPEVWLTRHQECFLALTKFVKQALFRCSINDLAIFAWFYGKVGPRVLTLELEKGEIVRDVVMRVLGRMAEFGVKGDLDCLASNNLLSGLNNLQISLEDDLRDWVVSRLQATVELADIENLTRLVFNLRELNLEVNQDLLQMISNTAEMKLKAGNYPVKTVIYLSWMISGWKPAHPFLHSFFEAFHQYLMENAHDLPSQEAILGVEALVNFQFYPSLSFLDQISGAYRDQTLMVDRLLSSFAELGIRPLKVLSSLNDSIKESDQEQHYSLSAICSILQSLCLLNSIQSDHWWNLWPGIRLAFQQLTDHDKTALYQTLLHLKYIAKEPDPLQQLDTSILAELQGKWRAREKTNINLLLMKIQALLDQLPCGVSIEPMEIREIGLHVIALQRVDGVKQYILVDTKTFHNKKKRITGSTLWRRRLLHELGWTSIGVDKQTNLSSLISVIPRH